MKTRANNKEEFLQGRTLFTRFDLVNLAMNLMMIAIVARIRVQMGIIVRMLNFGIPFWRLVRTIRDIMESLSVAKLAVPKIKTRAIRKIMISEPRASQIAF